jgi:hypothetical protein
VTQAKSFSINARRLATLAITVSGAVALAGPAGQAAGSASSLGKATAGAPKVVGTEILVPVSCASGGSYCDVIATLYATEKSKRVAIGFGEDELDAGASGTVKVTLLPAGERYLKKHSPARAKLVVQTLDGPPATTGVNTSRHTTIATVTVTLTRGATKK